MYQQLLEREEEYFQRVRDAELDGQRTPPTPSSPAELRDHIRRVKTAFLFESELDSGRAQAEEPNGEESAKEPLSPK